MKRTQTVVIAAFAVCAIAFVTFTAVGSEDEADPVFGIKIYPGYRDWKFISVAREDGNLNDLRVVLGNNIAIKAYREGTLPFPDGSVIARIAWKSTSSEENNKSSDPPNRMYLVRLLNGIYSLWSKTQRNTRIAAAGDLLNLLKMADRLM